MAGFGLEVVEALLQRLPQIVEADLADANLAAGDLYIGKEYFLSHGETVLFEGFARIYGGRTHRWILYKPGVKS